MCYVSAHRRSSTKLKKTEKLQPLNQLLLSRINGETVTVAICRVEAAEIDEMQSFVGKKADPRWLWHAIDHDSGEVMAYTLGRREDKVFLELKRLLQPFWISRFYTDKWGRIHASSRS